MTDLELVECALLEMGYTTNEAAEQAEFIINTHGNYAAWRGELEEEFRDRMVEKELEDRMYRQMDDADWRYPI